jgi:pimeloyl-[acyl-carrier protein] methyl ester esterase
MSFDLYIERAGQGPAASLLHGWGMNLRVFDLLRVPLARALALTLVDLPGHGRSPWPAHFTAGAQLQALTRTLLPAETLIGWSLGGQLALAMALATLGTRAAPKRLVLISTTPRFLASDGWSAGLPRATLQQFGESLELDPIHTLADFLGLQVRGSQQARQTELALRQALQQQGAAQLPALRAGLTQLVMTDLREQLAALPIPTLLIGGVNDRVTPPAALEAMARRLPCAELMLLPRAAHAPFLSHPAEVADAVLQFVAKDPAHRDGAPA